MESVLVYAGLLTALLGFVSLLRPLRSLRIRSRRAGGALLGAGLLLAVGGAALPAPLMHATGEPKLLDEFLPAYQFGEIHSIRVHAPPARTFQALKAVTAEDIRFFRLLAWIRSPRVPWKTRRENILAPPARQPILDVALRSGFLRLAEEPDRELVVGTVVCCGPARMADPKEFAELHRPGYAKAGMNFLLEDEGAGWTRVTTETRVFATDASARRAFALYWRVIYPGSALIRRMWLGAIKRAAEGP